MSAAAAPATSLIVECARDSNRPLGEQHSAFTLLVQQSQHRVFALALSRLRDVEDAKDAAQDAFAAAWRRLGQLRDPAAFGPWLNAIVLSECSRRRRRRAHRSGVETISARAIESDACPVDYQSLVAESTDERSLRTRDYDGEGRFGRNRRGEVTHFVYYEFGRRMGVAHRIRRADGSGP